MSLARSVSHPFVASLALAAGLAASEAAGGTQVLELDCHGAAPLGTSIHIEADVGGPAVMLAPYLPREEEIGTLTPTIATGRLETAGNRIRGSLKASIPRLGRNSEPSRDGPLSVELTIEAGIADGVISGIWTGSGAQGIVRGMQRSLPAIAQCDTGTLAMVTAYPADGRILQLGLGGILHQLGASFTITDGSITAGRMFAGAVRPSFYPVKRYTPAVWMGPDGRLFNVCATGSGDNNPATGESSDPITGVQASGRVGRDALEVTLTATYRGKPTTWQSQLVRNGALWHGTWTWKVPGIADASAVAVARLGSRTAGWPVPAGRKDPAGILLRHALALASHPSGSVWRDDLSAQAVRGNGNKQYDNAPNSVAAGIYIGLLIDRFSSDPRQKAEGLAMARRAACWGQTARFGKLRVGEYYKGMFWITAWQAGAMAELARREPEGPWKGFAAELATMQRDQQLPSGAWTWVDEETGERGHSNERGDRSLDNRELNCGDILLSMARCAEVSGADCTAAMRKGESWLLDQFGRPQAVYSDDRADKKARREEATKPPAAGQQVLAFFQDRRPGASKDCLPSVSFLLHLAEQAKPDAAAIATVRDAIEREFAEGKGGLLNGYYPRAAPGDPGSATDLYGSARYAHALARLAAKGDGTTRARAEGLIAAILAKAGAATGIIDHYGRELPAELDALGNADSHSYLCLKAGLAWELAEAIDVLAKKR